MIELNEQRIKEVLIYYNKRRTELEKITDGLAVKLGIDPQADTVLVPLEMVTRFNPKWIKYGTMKTIKHVQGVRKR